MDLTDYRNSAVEQRRVADLMALLPETIDTVLDVGARDGFIARLLAERSERVTALDLTLPDIAHERIECVEGDATALTYPDKHFEVVFCAEVLEHIPSTLLEKACSELARVARRSVVIGVPFKQDIRVAQTTCYSCGRINPPWGHVNSFDETRLRQLFPGFDIAKRSFVGVTRVRTNAVSSRLMTMAGNPYGTYSQQEPCVHCGAALKPPPARTLWQRVLTRAAFLAHKVQQPFVRPHANWIHLCLVRR